MIQDSGKSLYCLRTLSSHEAIALQTVDQWPLSTIVERVSEDMKWTSPFCATVEREYRKFIFLIATQNSTLYGMAGPVDEVWHEHILDTQSYLEMCDAVAGSVIHHIPATRSKARTVETAAYVQTLTDLIHFFGEAPPEVWPTIEGACRACLGCKAAVRTSDAQFQIGRKQAYPG